MTTLDAINLEDMAASMTVELATDSDAFEAFLEQVLCPKLKVGDVVVMDNLNVHKMDRLRELIEGARPVALSAALLPGPESYRRGVVEVQTIPALGQGTHRRCPGPGRLCGIGNHLRRQRSCLVPALRLWPTIFSRTPRKAGSRSPIRAPEPACARAISSQPSRA